MVKRLSNVDQNNESIINVPTPSSASDVANKSYVDTKVSKGSLYFNVKDYGAKGDGATDDTSLIQSALDAAATAGGGTVYFPASTYIVSNIKIDTNVEIAGASRGTVLLAKAGSTGYMISLKTPASSEKTTIRNITLKPNTGTLGGILLDNTGYGTSIDPIHSLRDVVVLNAGGDAFHFDNSMRELRVEGCYAHFTGGYGFYIGVGCTDSRFVSNTVGPSTNHGWYILGNNNNFVACKSFYAGFNGTTWGTTQSGFYLSNAAYCTFTNCSSQQSALHGYYLSGMKYSTVTGCEADTNSAGTTGGVGFYTTYCTYSSLIGCVGNNNGILSPGAQAYGIAVDGIQTEFLIYGNTVGGSSGEFQYVSGYGYMLISGAIADFTSIPIKINTVTQFGLAGSTSGSTAITPAATASGTWTLPSATDTFVGKATTDILTNKSISGATNTITGLPLSALSASGTPSATTYLRGDNTWATVSGGSSLKLPTYTVGVTGADFTTIQAALDAATSGGTIYLTDASYTITSTLLVKSNNIRIVGNQTTTINCDGATVTTAIKSNSTTYGRLHLENIIFNQTNATIQGVGLDASNLVLSVFENLYFSNFGQAIQMLDTANYTFYNRFSDIIMMNCNNGLLIGGTNPSNDNMFMNLRIAVNANGKSVSIIKGQSNNFYNLNCEPSSLTGTIGISIAPTVNGDASDNNFYGSYVEGNGTGISINNNAQRTTFFGGEIVGNTTNLTDSGQNTQFFGADVGYAQFNQQSPTSFTDNTSSSQTLQTLKNNTSFAHVSSNLWKAQLLNATDNSNAVRIENAGTGKNISSTNGTTETFSVDNAGAILSGGVAVPTITSTSTLTNKTLTKPILTASTTSAASLHVNTGVAPTSPTDGDMWYDGSFLQFKRGANFYGVVLTGDTQTLSNKRVNKRVITATSSATPTPTGDTADIWYLSTLTVGATFAAPTGTPTDGQQLTIRIKSVAAQTLAWNAIYLSSGVATLPTTSVAGKTITCGFTYDAAQAKWVLLAVDAVGY